MKKTLLAGLLMMAMPLHAQAACDCAKTNESVCDCKGDCKCVKEGSMTTSSGLSYQDIKKGEGATPQKGQTVVVHYTGWLQENNQKFDSSLDRNEPFRFHIGNGEVIPGWDEGVSTMKVGGKRRLIIPADLAYGTRGVPGAIPPHATLVFEVELLGVE